MKAVLRSRGLQVLEASDGEEGFALVKRLNGEFDLLVTDIQLPRMDGVAFAKAVRGSYPNLPIIHVSDAAPAEVEILCRDFPGMTFLHKPFQPKILLAAVDKLLPAVKSAGGR